MFRIAAVFAIATALTACGEDSLPKNANGKELFNHHCAGCHKASGKGSFMKGIPANNNTQLKERDIVRLIRYGHGEKPGMPVLGHISQKDATLIAGYVKDQL